MPLRDGRGQVWAVRNGKRRLRLASGLGGAVCRSMGLVCISLEAHHRGWQCK